MLTQVDARHDIRMGNAAYDIRTNEIAREFASEGRTEADRAYRERAYRQIANVFKPSLTK